MLWALPLVTKRGGKSTEKVGRLELHVLVLNLGELRDGEFTGDRERSSVTCFNGINYP